MSNSSAADLSSPMDNPDAEAADAPVAPGGESSPAHLFVPATAFVGVTQPAASGL